MTYPPVSVLKRWAVDEGADPQKHPDSIIRCVQHIGGEPVVGGDPHLAGAPDGLRQQALGRFRLSGIPAPRGVPQVQVAFDIDANGLLQVSATDRTTGRKQSVSIQGGSNLNEDEVTALLAEAEARADEDRKRNQIERSTVR